jgi:DNA polymerase (family 10)
VTPGSPSGGIPSLHSRLLALGALTPDGAAALLTRLGVVTLADLELALDDGRIERMLTPACCQRIEAAFGTLAAGMRPLTLGRAHEMLEQIEAPLRKTVPELRDVCAAGGARRYEPLVISLAVVAHSADPPAAIDAICQAPWVESVAFRSARRALVLVQHIEVDIRIASADEYGTVLFLATGPREHVQAVFGMRGVRTLVPREEDVYAQARLDWIPPELRHDPGAIVAARQGPLPRLVQRADIRGDLHMHTTYSDGQDTLETMVASALALGYEYIAITDHSENAGASRTVSRDMLSRQRVDIERMREKYPGIGILHGIEVDILANGELDFPDDVLEGLDLVLASLHDAAQHDPKTLTRRCLAAIEHPLVNVITHPSNQLVGRRPGYELDYPTVYAAAAATGTALEVDGAPSHLDLDGEHARAAVAAGATLTIDSDCHRARALPRQMEFGLGTARRGWVEPRHVLNTQPVEAVRAFVAAKRRR